MTIKSVSPDTVQSAVALANIVEAVTSVVKRVAGTDIASQINGSELTRDVLGMVVAQTVESELAA